MEWSLGAAHGVIHKKMIVTRMAQAIVEEMDWARAFRSMFHLYVFGTSTFAAKVSRTVGTCESRRRRTKCVGIVNMQISIWNHYKSINYDVNPRTESKGEGSRKQKVVQIVW